MQGTLPAHAMHVCQYMHTAWVQRYANVMILSLMKCFGVPFVQHVLDSISGALSNHAFLV